MKSLRLSQGMRDNIVDNVMKKWDESNVAPEVSVSRASLKNTLADEIHSKVYGKYEDAGLPMDMLNTNWYIKVQFPSEEIIDLDFTPDEGDSYKYRISSNQSKVEYVLSDKDPLYKKYKKGLEKYKSEKKVYDEHRTSRQGYRKQVREVLDGVNTTKQLLEQWPEVEPFLPVNLSNPSNIQLPSVNISELNKQL